MGDVLYRDATLEYSITAPEQLTERTIKLSFASEALVLRTDDDGKKYWEKLSLGPGDCQLDLLRTVGLLLEDHNEKLIIGHLEQYSAHICPDYKIRSLAKVSNAAWISRIDNEPNEIGVSVGYSWLSLLRVEISPNGDGLPVRVYAWRPYEVSLLSRGTIPADASVGIGRSRSKFMRTPIEELSELLNLAQTGSRRVEFLTRAEREEYSLCRLIRGESGVERNIASGNKYLAGQYLGGSFVPFQAFSTEHTRDMVATQFAQGGAFVQTDMAGVVPILLNHSVCVKLGATVASGLKGNLTLPREESTVTTSVTSEIAAAAASNPTVGALSMMPHRLSVNFTVSKQLLIQGGEGGEAFLRAMIFAGIGQKLDQLTLTGQGASDEPLGIVNTPGIGAVNFNGAAATWAKLMSFEDALGSLNADSESLGWAVSPSTRTRWKQIVRTANGTNFLWDQLSIKEALVGGFRALATNNLSAGHTAILGNWPFCVIGIWGNGFDLVTDPYSLAKDAEVIFSCHLWVDVSLLHPQGFCASSDSANN